MTNEVSQEQFDEASKIFAKIEELKQQQKLAPTLQEKFNIRVEISRLVEKRYNILGL